MRDTYDFIVVGGGTAGSALASRLAHKSPHIEVLLLEGGNANDDLSLRSPETRYSNHVTSTEINWGYKSTPQAHLQGREIDCSRGRGLGGSSAINFACWVIGDKEDFNEWAERVDDPVWKWEGENGVKKRFRKIENLHYEGSGACNKYVDEEAQALHSREGKIDVSYNQHWPQHTTRVLEAAKEAGMKLNGDLNSGDPQGWGLSPSSFFRGVRTTAASAYLSSPPANLTIEVNSIVSRIIFSDQKTAVGVETLNGKIYRASKEVILSAGSIDTPKILLLSGVGPADELSQLGIPVIENVPGVGKNLTDHCHASTTLLLKPEAPTPARSSDPSLQVGLECPMAWISSQAVKSSPEFAALDPKTQAWLQKVPSYELISPDIPLAGARLGEDAFKEGAKVLTIAVIVMNALSVGSVSLASADPTTAALIDVNYLSHPYDRRVIIEGLRAATKMSEVSSLAAITERRLEGPPGDADDDAFLEHAKVAVSGVWHLAGTCRMGKSNDESAVVDAQFRVKGIRGLRVADLSVAAMLPNNHTQSTAYLIGETAAEKLIAEYKL